MELQLLSTYGENKVIPITAYLMDELPPLQLVTEIARVKRLPFLRGLPMADTQFATNNRIYIILSLTDVNQCTTNMKKVTSADNKMNAEVRRT